VSVEDRGMVCAECTIGSKIILNTSDGLLGDEAQREACFVLFRDGALTQDRCTVCSERTIGMKIVFDAHDGTLR
jgi:hypothetical protein